MFLDTNFKELHRIECVVELVETFRFSRKFKIKKNSQIYFSQKNKIKKTSTKKAKINSYKSIESKKLNLLKLAIFFRVKMQFLSKFSTSSIHFQTLFIRGYYQDSKVLLMHILCADYNELYILGTLNRGLSF